MKKRILIALGLILLIILLLAGLLVPFSTKADVIPLSQLPPDYRKAIPSDTYCDTAYMVENRYVLRKTQTLYITPVALVDLNDVGTAGTSYWEFTLYVVSPTRYTAKLKDLQFEVEGDANTVLYNEIGPSPGYLTNKLTVLQNEMRTWDDDTVYLATLHVATNNSLLAATKECEAVFRWTGTIRLGHFMPDIDFEINGSQSYMGNVKN